MKASPSSRTLVRFSFGMWMLALLIAGLMIVAAPKAAVAADGLDSAPAREDAANSWRYDHGVPRLDVDTNHKFDGQDQPVTIADELPRYVRDGSIWRAVLGGQTITVSGATALGIDVSEWNGVIDWASVKASGVDYAIIRCGFGADRSTQDDDYFLENVRGCQRNGIPFGLYLYSYADSQYWAASEADHVVRLLSEADLTPDDLTYPIYYDLEEQSLESVENRDLLATMATTFCDRIEAEGYEAGVYSNYYWWTVLLTSPVFDRWERWVAEWPTVGYEDAGTHYVGEYGMWQAGSGLIDGIYGATDIDFDYEPRLDVPASDATPGAVFRLYNPYSGEHLYTQLTSEVHSNLVAGWTYEGPSWTAPESGEPVYRLYNPYNGEHLYTTDEAEYQRLGGLGWHQESVVFRSSVGKEIPVYRLYNPYVTIGTHLFTRDEREYEQLGVKGWRQEGACLYGAQ